MQSPLPYVSAFLLATAAAAQNQLEVSGFDNIESEPVWAQETDSDQVALRFTQLPGEHTILLVHTCVDASVAGPAIARGIATALPFMALPKPSWSIQSPELAALSANYDFGDPLEQEELMIPPRRVALHLQQVVANNYDLSFGPAFAGGATGYLLAPGDIVAPMNYPADERVPLGAATWSPHNKVQNTIDASAMGYDSVIQTAHEYHATIPGLPPLDQPSLQTLGSILSEDIGFIMHVQAFHITPPGGGNTKVQIRYGRHVKLRRRDLAEINEELFTTVYGKDAWIPWPIANDTMVHFGEFGGVLMFEFDAPVGFAGHLTTLTGLFPTAGGYKTLPQLPNPVDEFGVPSRANVALFECDPQIQPGQAFFIMTSHPTDILPVGGVLMLPLHGFGDGALVLPYEPSDPEPPSAL